MKEEFLFLVRCSKCESTWLEDDGLCRICPTCSSSYSSGWDFDPIGEIVLGFLIVWEEESCDKQ